MVKRSRAHLHICATWYWRGRASASGATGWEPGPGSRAGTLRSVMPGRIIAVMLVCTCAGCDPMRPEDKAWFAEREQQRARREALMRDVRQQVRPDELIKFVRQAEAADGSGTNEDWMNQRIAEMGGQIMFPRWEVSRRASNKQEVTFQFLLIGENSIMRRYAFAWVVDALDMSIAEPRLLGEEDVRDDTVREIEASGNK